MTHPERRRPTMFKRTLLATALAASLAALPGAAEAACAIKNTVPFDPESPFVTSGLRLGSAALTTRGFDAAAFVEVADVIADRLIQRDDAAVEQRCRERVADLCQRFPLYAQQRQLQNA